MKRKFSLVMSAAMILSLIAPMTNALAEDIQTPETATPETVVTEDAASGGTTYYVDSTIGDDSNSGTSPETPWKSLDKVTATTFLPGDTILLKSGSVWNGEWLWPKGSGTADAPIKIDKYGGDALPVINGMGIDRGMNYSGAVHLRNQEYWEIRNLEVTNDDDFDVDIDLSRPQGDNSWSSQAETRNGILIIADGDLLNDDDDGIFDHIYIENCYVHDVDGPNDWNDTFTGGIIYNVVGTKIRPNTSFRDIRIAYNTIRKVDLLGITGFVQMAKSGYQDDVDTYNLWMEDIYIGHNYIEDVAQGGIDLCDARNAVVEYNVVDGFLKRYPNFRPTVALYPWKCENSVLQYNEVYNGPSTNADGSPYDMDSALKNVVYQFNYSHNNPCGWMLYMGRNTNDIIRYNISDDGGDFIIKYFLTANATPAYFVNNVIMYDGARTTFMHRDPFKSQTYFYNNVFYNKSTTTTTTWHDTKRYLGNLGSVTFSHNCFYEASGIHSQYEPADDYKVTENPDMVNPGQTPQQNSDGILSGATVWDGYKLNASSPLIDAGIYVPQMGTTDFYGTQLYWGNAPDIGVHEYQQGEYNNPSNFALGKTVTSTKISLSNLSEQIQAHRTEYYTYTISEEVRTEPVQKEVRGQTITVQEDHTYTIFTLSYVGDDYFADTVWQLDDKQKSYADAYAHNLTVYLHEIEEREGITILGQINDSLIDDNSPAPSGGFGNPFNDPNWEQHITSFFGKREDVGIPGKDTTNHNGLDIAYPYGTPILAVEAGTVIKAGYHVSYGNYLVINHGGGYCTLYAHCSQLLAQVGDTVNKYDTIAKVGATGDVTGNHLHICVIIDGVYVNPKGYLH